VSRRIAIVAALVLALASTSLLAGGAIWGGFASKTPATNANNKITAATDFLAPTITDTVIAKTTGGIAGTIRKGGTYYVYANAADTGNPASGVSTIKANVSSITSAQTAATLSAGTFTVEGKSFTRRSASLTAGSTLAAGTASYALTVTDANANARTESGFTVAVDNTAPTGTDVQTSNGGATVGLAEAGDQVTYTFSKAIDPNSVLAGWSGVSTSIVVRLNQATKDTVTVYNATNATLLPLGTLTLGATDYTTANLTFGATGTASTMVMSDNQIVVTLGTQSAAASAAAATGTMSWTPSATATDASGNPTATTAATESGAADKEF
jgi:hypothetical protein